MAEKDSRTYIRVHDGMPDHPKVEPLSDAAFRLLVTTWCWNSRYLTDGHVPAATRAKRGKAKVWEELIVSGLADENEDGSLTMHHYTEHQRTAEEVVAIKAARATASERANHVRWHEERGVVAPDCSLCVDPNEVQGGSDPDPKSDPKSIRNDSALIPIDIGIDIDKGKTSAPDPFDAWWKAYPKKKDKPLARTAYAAALKKPGVTPALLLAALEAQLPTMTDLQYVIYPERWLKRERWADEVETSATQVPPAYWSPTEAPPRGIADDPDAYSAWYAEQAAKRGAAG